MVLEPDTVCEARLVPLLYHEDFSAGLAGWTVVDAGTNAAPSAWAPVGHPVLSGDGATTAGTVVTLTGAGDLSVLDPASDVVLLATDILRPSKSYRVLSVDNATKQVTLDAAPMLFWGVSAWEVPASRGVVQTSNIWGGSDTAADPAKPGTMLVGGDAGWTDYRVTVLLHSSDDDAVGVVFRYLDAANHYRYSMDAERGYRRLVRVSGGAYTVLAEDDFRYQPDQDYEVTAEAVGARIRVYQDGALVFEVTDGTFSHGRIGLYCWANTGAHFADVRVDDLGAAAPVAYRFSFTTSRYAGFYDHLHS